MRRLTLTVIVCVALSGSTAQSQDEVAQLSRFVDQVIESSQQAESISPTQIIDDYLFARRLTLDLAGRVPTHQELRDFVDSRETGKRATYVDRLLGSPDFAYQLRNTLDALLLAERTKDDAWRAYLLEATNENRSWDRIFREIMLPERERDEDKRPAAFLRARAKDVDAMTNDASVLLFGVNIACAKCHDHPLVSDWEQQHYFGFASFFQRTFATRSGFVAEKFDGRLKFTSVAGDEHQAEFMFLNGASVPEPDITLDKAARKELNEQIRASQRKDDAPRPPAPEFSPRAELVRLALSAEGNSYFARNIVNRVWARLMGRGLVHPLDQMHSENPPSHPEVLERLAEDFIQHGYDLKRLIHCIVLTQTYARSSRWTEESEPPPPELFARGIARPLTPWQLALSLHIASRAPNDVPGLSDSKWETQRQQLERQSSTFAARLPLPSGIFQVGTDEALLFSNSKEFHSEFLSNREGQLVHWLSQLKDRDQLIDNAFLTTISRLPTATERGAVDLHFAQRADEMGKATEHLIWTLLASPEFRFNY